MHTSRSRSGSRFLLLALLAVLGPALTACAGDADEADEAQDAQIDTAATAATPSDDEPVMVADAGFQTPESVLHDAEADVYLVSNINGQPVEKDDNGFISRVRPDGTVEELRWIDAEASEDVTLHAPKGLAVKGDTLFVADIDSVRAFNRTTGDPYGARGVPGATFLNDLAVGPDGTLYVSDSGLNADFSPSGTDGVYRFEGAEAVAVIEGSELEGPHGITVSGGDLYMVPFRSATVRRVPLAGGTGTATEVATLPGGQLDGVVALDDGSLLVSSWETGTVYRVPANGEPTVVVEGIPSPADIGWDGQRRRVLVPSFNENRLELHPVR